MQRVKQIFISYKSADRHLAEKLRDQLQAWGYHVWLDFEQIGKGEYFRHKIDEGLRTSQLVMGIATQEAVKSREVMWEWDYALDNSRLIPLIYDNFDLPYHIRGTQYIDCRSDEKSAFVELQKAISHPIESSARQPLHSSRNATSVKTNTERETMLRLVHSMWIEGVLYPTLRENNQLNIPKSLAPDKVLHHIEFGDYDLPDNSDILAIFEDMHRELLILGDPGAGKTILMLQLAEKLIEQARYNALQPIPIIVNLSSWGANPNQSIEEWLIREIHDIYQANISLIKKWIESEKLLLLLDGLDEVNQEYRNECVVKLNKFRAIYRFVDFVICSRIKDYDMLSARLNLRSGLILESLQKKHIENYLKSTHYTALRETIKVDKTLEAFSKVPFMLNIMGIAYRDAKLVNLKVPVSNQSENARRNHLLERYFEAIVSDFPNSKYPPKDIRKYLAWLASMLIVKKQKQFIFERLDQTWLNPDFKVVFHAIMVRAIFGFIFGGITFFLLLLMDQFVYSLIVAIVVAIVPVDYVADRSKVGIMASQKNWGNKKGYINWSLGRGYMGLFSGLLSGLLIVFGGILFCQILPDLAFDSTLFLPLPPFLAILGFLVLAPNNEEFSPFIKPNQGIYLTVKYSLQMLALGCLVGMPFGYYFIYNNSGVKIFWGITYFLLMGMGASIAPIALGLVSKKINIYSGVNMNMDISWVFIQIVRILQNLFLIFLFCVSMLSIENPLAVVISTSIFFGASFFANFGLGPVQHLALRQILKYEQKLPTGLQDFTDYMSAIGFMRKTGGSYIFRHRYLLEYFADQFREEDYRHFPFTQSPSPQD